MITNHKSNKFKRSFKIEAYANYWLNAERGSLLSVLPLVFKGALVLSTPLNTERAVKSMSLSTEKLQIRGHYDYHNLGRTINFSINRLGL